MRQLPTVWVQYSDGFEFFSWCDRCKDYHWHSTDKINTSEKLLGQRLSHCSDRDFHEEYQLLNYGPATPAILRDVENAKPVGPVLQMQ